MRLGRMLGIGAVWSRMGTTAKVVGGTIAAAALALWQWGEKLLVLVNSWLNN